MSITTDCIDFKNFIWSNVATIIKAHEGVRGAWFFVDSQGNSVVLKSQAYAENQIMGSIFLLQMGLNPPESRIIERASQEGALINSLTENSDLNASNPSHYIIMNRVFGPSYSQLTSGAEDVGLVKNNLVALGALAVYDLVLCNFDRFHLDSMAFNGGNIMFQDGQLRPIDTDCNADIVQTDRFTSAKFFLKKIALHEKGYNAKIIKKLADNLGDGYVHFDTVSEQLILAGMDIALKHIKDFSNDLKKNEYEFVESCKNHGVVLQSFPKKLEELITYVSEIKGDSPQEMNITRNIHIATPDSLQIAVQLLRFQGIEIPPSLSLLIDKISKTPKTMWNEQFAQEVSALKTRVIQDLSIEKTV
ncbi:MAG: hypothetical protein FJZ63_04840 [Chlamydiae bacterium]|nr:hypothetical protein [Chlamydiota bacterium]